MSSEPLKAILQMHQGRWTNELTVGDCGYVYDRVLTEHERTVVNFKIEGFSNAEIAKFLGVKVATIRVLKYKIMRKYRHKEELRCDNWRQL